jgi:hypothetical protein
MRLLLCLLVLPLIVGCGSNLGIVSGTVTLDGQPVPTGTVTFVKEDGSASEGAVIAEGKFQAKIPPGKYKLELTGQKVVSTRIQKDFDGKDEVLPVMGPLFPKKYNEQSTLIEEIKAGPHPINLELSSGP